MSSQDKSAYNKNMDSNVTKRDLTIALNKVVDDVGEQIADLGNYVHDEIASMRSELQSVRGDYTRVMNSLDSFLKQMADKDVEDAARDAQLARHDKWIRSVAKKTDTELTY